MKTISEINVEFTNCSIDTIDKLINYYFQDNRKGVQDIIKRAIKRKENYEKEQLRISQLYEYENVFYKQGKIYIAGVDEVGRGPLAGPVVSAAVILPKNAFLIGVNDSKKLSEKQRKTLFQEINEQAIEIQISMENSNVIDEINILQATIKSMEKAINNFKQKPEQIIVDAVKLPNVNISQLNMNKADEKSISVAAASIIAKVTRDEIMDKYHEIYPEYAFNKNKGYGTKEHIDALKKYGPCPIHRMSFLKNLL